MAITDNKDLIESMRAVQSYMAANKPMPRFENSMIDHLMSDNCNSNVIVSQETVEVKPKNNFHAFLVKVGIKKAKTRPKSIKIEYKPRIKE